LKPNKIWFNQNILKSQYPAHLAGYFFLWIFGHMKQLDLLLLKYRVYLSVAKKRERIAWRKGDILLISQMRTEINCYQEIVEDLEELKKREQAG
jgi:hypothetical protein